MTDRLPAPAGGTTPLLVFSDLDGSLLDHHDYSWQAAAGALARLRDLGAGLVLASSKTAAEIAPLRAAMGFADWPALVENGSGILPEDLSPQGADGSAQRDDYARLRAILPDLPPGFRGFGDMSAAEIAGLTGLAVAQAERARARQFSEPGIWAGPAAAQEDFLAAAAARGLVARRGGRFLTLSFGATKASRMATLCARYQPRLTLALGDAPNDIEMLEAADYGVIIANPSGSPIPPLPGEATGRITRPRAPGPEGWARAVSDFLDLHLRPKEPSRHG